MSNTELQHIVICGVSGAGKSTVAREVAKKINGVYQDADDFHSHVAKEKMRSGVPLTDDDRRPWLQELVKYLEQSNRPVVLACSALKQHYRTALNTSGNLQFIVLDLSLNVAMERVRQRGDQHFMPESLVESQFDVLEVGEDCMVVNAERPLAEVIKDCLQ